MKKIILFILLLLNLHVTIDKGSLNLEFGRMMAQSWLEETLPEVVVTGSQYTTCIKCYMTVEKRYLQTHLELDCPKRTVLCGFCNQSYVFCEGHNCTVRCAICHKPANECICNGYTCNGHNSSGNSTVTVGNGTGSSSSSSGGGSSNTGWTSTLYSPMYNETMIPNYKIPTEWRGQLPDKYACFLCCMEYIYNIQHSTPDYKNGIHINGTKEYADYQRSVYKYDYNYLYNTKGVFLGVLPSHASELLSYENFQHYEIGSNEIKSYLDSQYLIIISYKIYNNEGIHVQNHAVLVVGYDNGNNLIIVDPITGVISKKKNDGDYISIIAISPYTYN